jgi:large subunit ribosomal protein LX
MPQYVVSGRFQTRRGFQEFRKTVDAPNDEVARERIYAAIGSQHGLKRTRIELSEVTAA